MAVRSHPAAIAFWACGFGEKRFGFMPNEARTVTMDVKIVRERQRDLVRRMTMANHITPTELLPTGSDYDVIMYV